MISMKDTGYGDLFGPANSPYMAGGQQAGGYSPYRERLNMDERLRYGQPRRRTGRAGGATPEDPNEDPYQLQRQGQPAQQQGQPAQQQPVGNYQDYGSVMSGAPATPTGTGVQNPQQWGQAEQMYQNAATNPWFGQAAGGYGQMMETGMPTDQSAAYQASKGVAQQDIVDAMKQAQESMGGSSFGKRYSSAMGRGNQEIASKRMGELGQQTTQQAMAAQEAARQRQLQAAGGMLGAAQGYGANQMGAAGGMAGLGQMQGQYGLNLANSAYQMGSGLYGQQQNQANDLGNYWAGNQWWSNPAIAGLQQGSQYSPEYMYPQYKQSTVGQGLNILGSIFG